MNVKIIEVHTGENLIFNHELDVSNPCKAKENLKLMVSNYKEKSIQLSTYKPDIALLIEVFGRNNKIDVKFFLLMKNSV